MQTSVVETLKTYGIYRDNGRIEEQMLVSILPNGEKREHKMSEINYADIKIFADELDIALRIQNPLVQELFAKNAVALANLVRVVNVESASGFKGTVGSGRQLDAVMLRAEQTQNPGAGATTPRTSWSRAVGAAGDITFLQSTADTNAELAMGTTEGLAILGFINPAAAPCVDMAQLGYLAQLYNVQNMDFELANPFIGDAIVELKQPFFIYPQETGLVNVRYYKAGTDELRPIGLWVKMASNLRALATS